MKYIKLIILAFVYTFYTNSISAYDFEQNGLCYYILSGNEVEVTYKTYRGYSGNVTIPQNVIYQGKSYTVTSVGDEAFMDCLLTSIEMPTSIRSIGEHAFSSTTLKEVSLPINVESIGNAAFSSCSKLSHVTMPTKLISIGNWAFQNCIELETIDFPLSLRRIGLFAFLNCHKISKLFIPKNLNYINESAFDNCNSITSIEVDSDNSVYDSREKCNAIIETNTNRLIQGCSNTFIPKSVTSIEMAFRGCTTLKSISIPPNVVSIISAFLGCINLENIQLSEGLKTIGENAFMDCKKLEKIQIPQSVTTIDGQAFFDCYSLKSVVIPSKIQYIGLSAFQGCQKLSYVESEIENPFSIREDVFSDISYDAILMVPYGTKEKYQKFSGWTKNFHEILEKNAIVDFTLSITASGNGSATYSSTTIKNKTQSFIVNKGASATVTFSPDNGYRIASVKVNNTNVTSSVSNNKYTINNITANTTLTVTFEAIPVTTYTLSVSSSGSGSTSYNGTTIRGGTQSFTVNSGTSATVSFTPDNGYRIASVKVNNTDVTSSVSNNKYTISNITANTTLAVTFEAIPVTTYSLTISSSGSGSTSYNGTVIRGGTQSFTVNSGASATVTFSPDSGYKIASVKVNNTDVTSSVSNNKYTISNITANTTLTVTYQSTSSSYYTLSITASGNGKASIGTSTTRNGTTLYSFKEGSPIVVTFTPDSGNRLAKVTMNDVDITSKIVNNQFTINAMYLNVTLVATFEEIPVTKYTLTISSSANGSAEYNGTTIRGGSQAFPVNEGTSATVSFIPDKGYRIASVKVNNTDVTSSVSNNKYTISNITANTTLSVTFEAIPPTTYTLSITASGNGSATYSSTTARNQTRTFTVNEGTSATVTLSPDSGYRIANVKVNNTDVTSSVTNNKYTISNITANTTLTVAFEEDVTALTVDGVNYSVISQTEKTVKVAKGNYGQVLTVPATVTQNGKTWTVTGISNDALKDSEELAAVIWNPSAAFTATVSNPNLLLYVKSEEYAPAAIKNVVVNGTASSITLTDATSGNSFYCPQAFTARNISYTHRYSMTTGIGESRGWETLALPFDVQSITHETKGDITPFANRKSGDANKPFWLYELTGSGFVEAASIKAYTPYIISMPNNAQYDSQWLLSGSVTFAASNVTVGKTEDVNTATYQDRTFVPNFVDRSLEERLYALNVNNDYTTNESGMTEGSKFVLNMRTVHPFEAYMTTVSNARQVIDVFEDMTTDIRMLGIWEQCGGDDGAVYDLQGRKVSHMTKGVYIGKKGQTYIIK